jgi:hypothetical protein
MASNVLRDVIEMGGISGSTRQIETSSMRTTPSNKPTQDALKNGNSRCCFTDSISPIQPQEYNSKAKKFSA